MANETELYHFGDTTFEELPPTRLTWREKWEGVALGPSEGVALGNFLRRIFVNVIRA